MLGLGLRHGDMSCRGGDATLGGVAERRNWKGWLAHGGQESTSAPTWLQKPHNERPRDHDYPHFNVDAAYL